MHVRALSGSSDAELTAVCAGSEKSLREAQGETGVPAFTDYAEFLRRGDTDAVVIVTPNHTHARLAVEALAQGKDVYLEKPIATSLADAKRVVEAQGRSQRVVQIGFENRYSSFWKAAKSALVRGDIGDPAYGKVESWRFPMREGSGGWKYDRGRVGHQLFEEAVHYADLSNWLFGEGHKPARVSGFLDPAESPDTGTFRSACFVVEFEGGRRFLVSDVLEGFGSDLSLMVAGTGGSINGAVRAESDDSPKVESYLKMRDREGRATIQAVHPSGQLSDLKDSLSAFVGAVQGRSAPGPTVQDGFTALAICDAALESARSGSTAPVRSAL
jgi:myo-inositol 2-dehydrogenase/D-chiro-inositol 1-dehydrogenase